MLGISLPGLDQLTLEKFTEQIKQSNLEGQKKWLADRVKNDMSYRSHDKELRREDGLKIAEKLQRQLEAKVENGTATERTLQRLDIVNRYRDFLEMPGTRPGQAPVDVRSPDAKLSQPGAVDVKAPVEATHAAHETTAENDPNLGGEKKGRLRLFENDVYIEKRASDPQLLGGTSRNFVARGEGKQEAQGKRLNEPAPQAPPAAESTSDAGGEAATEGATNARERMSAAAKEKAATTLREKAATAAPASEKQTMGEQGAQKPRMGEEPKEKPALGQPKDDKFIAADAQERVQKGTAKQRATEDAPALRKETFEKLTNARERLAAHVDGIEKLPPEELRKLRAEISQLEKELKKLDRQLDPKSVQKGDRADTSPDQLRNTEQQLAKQLVERQKRLEKLVEKQAVSGKGGEKTPEMKELEKQIGETERELWKVRGQLDPKSVRKRDRLVTAGDQLRDTEAQLAKQLSERMNRLEKLVEKQTAAGKGDEKTPEIKGLEKEIGQLERRRTGLQKRIADNVAKIADIESVFVSTAGNVGAAQAAGKAARGSAATLLGGDAGGTMSRPDGVRSFRATRNDSVSRIAQNRLEEQGLLEGLDDDAQDALIEKACDLIFRRNHAVLGAHPDHVMRGQELELPDFKREFGKSANKQANAGVFSHIRA